MEGSLCQDEMEQILELSEKLLPTLDKTDQATLQQSLANINQRVNFVIGAAQKRQDLLERKVTEWRDYDVSMTHWSQVSDQQLPAPSILRVLELGRGREAKASVGSIPFNRTRNHGTLWLGSNNLLTMFVLSCLEFPGEYLLPVRMVHFYLCFDFSLLKP